MSLDITLFEDNEDEYEYYSCNITHNLSTMAYNARIYDALWHPSKIGAIYAKDIINIVQSGLNKFKDNPEKYDKFSASNGWGTYKQFIPWLEDYLSKLKEFPLAKIYVSG